jgi:hypothetical protein
LEDRAILKNGDLACFANEDFVLKPFGLGLSMAGANSGRGTCGCKCDPCGCGTEGEPEDKPIFDAFDLSVMKGECPMPPITKALTQEQYDSVDKERRSDD